MGQSSRFFVRRSIGHFAARGLSVAIALVALPMIALLPIHESHAAEKWQGKATNTSGNFNYGKVTFTKSGSTIKDLKIEGVTTSGCGGYKNVFVPRVKVQGTRFSATYQPIPGIDDFIRVSGTIRGKNASGVFSEGPLCSNAGKFTAKRK